MFRPGLVTSTSRSIASPLSPTTAKEEAMFCVIFEVHPKADQWDGNLANAKMLRPDLEQVDGFIDNIRY